MSSALYKAAAIISLLLSVLWVKAKEVSETFNLLLISSSITLFNHNSISPYSSELTITKEISRDERPNKTLKEIPLPEKNTLLLPLEHTGENQRKKQSEASFEAQGCDCSQTLNRTTSIETTEQGQTCMSSGSGNGGDDGDDGDKPPYAHCKIPDDKLEVSEDEHQKLLCLTCCEEIAVSSDFKTRCCGQFFICENCEPRYQTQKRRCGCGVTYEPFIYVCYRCNQSWHSYEDTDLMLHILNEHLNQMQNRVSYLTSPGDPNKVVIAWTDDNLLSLLLAASFALQVLCPVPDCNQLLPAAYFIHHLEHNHLFSNAGTCPISGCREGFGHFAHHPIFSYYSPSQPIAFWGTWEVMLGFIKNISVRSCSFCIHTIPLDSDQRVIDHFYEAHVYLACPEKGCNKTFATHQYEEAIRHQKEHPPLLIPIETHRQNPAPQ